MQTFWRRSICAVTTAVMVVGVAGAQQTPPAIASDARESLQDAWWTGPLLANSAATLPRGHYLAEPYIYDIIGPHSQLFGSRAYVLYGLTNKLTTGVIPIVGYNQPDQGPNSSGVKVGDITLLGQYRLTQFHEHSWVPTTAIEVQQTFPSGKYDHLGTRPSDGLGAGAYTTTVSLNTQTYFWLPNGRILRTRLDVSQSVSGGVDVEDASVYGTSKGFRGRAEPGKSLTVDLAPEYSLTRQWVLALDALYEHNGSTSVMGTQNAKNLRQNSGSSWAYGFAPAVEYNVSPKLGVIFGARLIAPGHNSSLTVAPVMAINFVH
ncbi:MAG: hypothetical protein ABSF15_18085 [Candidatus Sulfotelmatobacter sp.]